MANPTLYDPVTFNNENELNVIIDERVKFDREYIILDRIKVHNAIEDPDTLLTIFTTTEMNILFKQAFEMDYLNQNEYSELLIDSSKVYEFILMDNIHDLLMKQFTYITKIPNMSDLEANGLFDSIIRTIQNNPQILISQPLVEQYTDEYLIESLTSHNFISFNDTEFILEKQSDFISILGQSSIDLLNRVKPYISFITNDKINEVQLEINSGGTDIIKTFSSIEIKFIIDKEIELKYLLLKTLTPNSVKILFTDLKNEWINTDLNSLVEEHFNVLKQELFGIDYDDLIRSQVDSYLTLTYNTLIQSNIDNAFTRFKTEFINIELQEIIKDYFDILKQELFGNNYNDLIETQVENYLNTNFPIVTDNMIQTWISEI